MSFGTPNNYAGRISPIGTYNPVYRQQPIAPIPLPNQRPLPSLPQLPYQAPLQQGYPQYSTQQPGVYPTVPQNNFFGAVVQGMKEQAQTIGQYVMHPLNASARRLPLEAPSQQQSTGEKVGHWVVDGALAAGALVVGGAVLEGAGLIGGGASVGTNSFMFGFGSALNGLARGVGSILMAPVKFIASLFGSGAGVGSSIGFH